MGNPSLRVAMKLTSYVAAIGAALFVSVAAHADPWPQWLRITTDQGCVLYNHAMTYDGHATDTDEGYVWSEPCSAGQPINGEGTLYWQLKTADWSEVRSYKGRVVDGYFDGPVQYRIHSVGKDGSWDPARGEIDTIAGEVIPYERGCGWYKNDCKSAQVADAVTLSRVSPAHFPLPGRTVPNVPREVSQFVVDGSHHSGSQGSGFLAGKRVNTPLKSGGTLQGSTNLECVVFIPGENGPDARSQLVNRCSKEISYNFCLITTSGSNNCFPISPGYGGTDVRTLYPETWHTLPAANELKLWAVFACESPAFPLYVEFKDNLLTNGICPDADLAPPYPQPGEALILPRHNDSKTWPPLYANKNCFHYSPRLMQPGSGASIAHDCSEPQNIHMCAVNNGSFLSPPACYDNPLTLPQSFMFPNRAPWAQIFGKPNSYRSAHVFSCDAPLYPDEIRWDGQRLSGTCKELPSHMR